MFGVTEKLPLQGTEPESVGPESVQLDACVAEVVSMSDCPMAMFAAEAVSVTVGAGGWLLNRRSRAASASSKENEAHNSQNYVHSRQQFFYS
jgi:hypothetical protein